MPAPIDAAAPPPGERNVLVAGSDLARVDRFVPTLRRAGFSVRRVPAAAAAMKLVRERPLELIVVVLPLESARELLEAVRAEGSPCRRTAVVVVAREGEDSASHPLGAQANRVLPDASSPEELVGAADLLLNAAPRVSVKASARLLEAGGEPRAVAVRNLSSTGMLVASTDPPAVGSLLGFELSIPSLGAAIRGQVQVLRHTDGARSGERGVAVSFVSFGGEGAKLLESVIFQERAAAGARQFTGRPAEGAPIVVEIRDAEELALRREELAELSPFLEEQLRRGLAPRMKAAEWYTAAAELGLESLGAFIGIMETVYGGRAKKSEISQQLADLGDVRARLGEFVTKRDVESRVEILLGIRQSLERLLHALATTSALTEKGASPSRQRGIVAELVHDIQFFRRSRQILRDFPGLIAELERPRYLIARGALRRRAEEIAKEYLSWSAELGLEESERLLSAAGRREVLAAADREGRRVGQRLSAIHQKIYGGKFRSRASRDQDADLDEAKLSQILVETLAAGAEFLARAYTAYRHALELTRSDPRLLDRVAGLTVSVSAAEHRLGRVATPAHAAR